MAITNICGFETGAGGTADNETTLVGAAATIQTTTKRTGDYALKILPVTTGTAYANNVYCSHLATGDTDASTGIATAYWRFYVNFAALPTAAEPIFRSVNTAVIFKFELRINQNGNLSAHDALLSALGTGSTVLTTGTWYRIEVKIATGASAAWEVKINGTSELSGSTADLTTGNNRNATFGKQINRNGSGYEAYYDDIACSDSAYPGAGAIQCIRPDGNGNYTAWAGVYTDVDDLVGGTGNDGDTTKWTSSTTTQAETATLESCATRGISGTINAVKTITVVKRTSGSATNIKHRLRVTSPGTADTDLTDYATTASFVLLASVRTVNPSGGAAWATAGVDSLEVGVVHNQAQARQADCTMVCAMVDYTVALASEIFNPMFQRTPRTLRI